MKSLLDIIESNENWDEQINHCADILCKFVKGHKTLPKKLCTLQIAETTFAILQEFYEQILKQKEER